MKLINILDLVEHDTFIGKKTRLDNKNMYIISYKNPLPSLHSCYISEKTKEIIRDLLEMSPKAYNDLPCYAIYSYETIVAYIIYDNDYKNIVLLRTDKKYSRTTSKQLTQLERSLFRVINSYLYDYTIVDYNVDLSIF